MRRLAGYSVITLLVVGLVAGISTGCAAVRWAPSGGVPEVILTLTSDQTVIVGKTPCDVGDIVARVVSAGAGQDTVLKISVPEGTPRPALSRMVGSLQSAGFTKVLFLSPKQIKTSVSR